MPYLDVKVVSYEGRAGGCVMDGLDSGTEIEKLDSQHRRGCGKIQVSESPRNVAMPWKAR